MAKKSMINRENKRKRTVERFAEKRAELKELIRNPSTDDEVRRDAQQRLQKLPHRQLLLEMSQLFVVRRESAPSPQPQRRLDRARLFLESGRTGSAIAEVRNLPGVDNAGGWLRDAERYAATQRALDLIETAAVLEPRNLRDGAGNRIEQVSPAEES